MPILKALIAALAFGLSAPLAKLLLAVVLVGGVLAPPLLLWGLARSPATTTALLLNLEVVFTAILAGIVFGEHLGSHVGGAAVVMALGGVALGWTPGDPAITVAAVAVALACALWALDNNLTRLIAEGDPLLIVEVKGLVAGTVNTLLALASGQPWPPAGTIALGMALGALSYGTSLVLFILAMRELGAARTGAYFATAPFFGADGGLLLGESPTAGLIAAAALMAAATAPGPRASLAPASACGEHPQPSARPRRAPPARPR